MRHAEQLIERLIAEAIAKAETPVEITRADGSTYTGYRAHQTAEDGDFQVYVIPVEQRTRAMKAHYRVTYYLKVDGRFKRMSRTALLAAGEQEKGY